MVIEKSLKSILIERDEIIEAIVRGMLAKHNVLLLGPPGTAKSLTIKMVCQHITGGQMFATLMNKFSAPEELFGPYSVVKMEEDIFERKTDGFLPDAHFAFIDEVFKGNAGVLNSLLSIMNERVYYNGNTEMHLPLFSLIGASNEVPDEDDGLEAYYDRFHIKTTANYIQETAGFARMLGTNYAKFRPEVYLTLEEIHELQAAVEAIEVPGLVIEKILTLRNTFKTEGIGVSDRTWNESLNAVKANALMRGKTKVEERDLEFLKNMLWSNPEEQDKATDIIYEEVNPDKQEALKLVMIAKDVLAKIEKNTTTKDKLSEAIGGAAKIKDLRASFTDIQRKRAKYAETDDDLDIFGRQLQEIAQKLVKIVGYDGTGLDFTARAPKKKR